MQTIIVDMTPGFRMPTIYYSQGDIGTQFAVDLRSRFGDSLPAGATVTIQATKPSGFGFSEAATSVTNGVAVFTTVSGMTDEAGRFAAELKVEASGITLFTANFYMNGEATTHPEGTIDGSEETVIPELTQLVERAEEAASSVLDRQTVTNTLPAGSQASYTFDEETNTQTFGIPQGEAGAGAAGVTASAYSSSKTYAVGDYVIHNSNLYRCTTAITTAEAFTAAHWTQVVLADDVSDLKDDLNALYDVDLVPSYENGYMQIYDGNVSENASSCVTGYTPVEAGKTYIADNVFLTYSRAIYAYGSDYARISNIVNSQSESVTTYEFTAPAGASFVRITGHTGTSPTLRLKSDILSGIKTNANSIKKMRSVQGRMNGDWLVLADDFEVGGISFSLEGWTYAGNPKRVRTKEGIVYSLKKGDIVSLSDYDNYYFVLGILKPDGTYGFTGSNTSDYKMPYDGDVAVVIQKSDDSNVANIEDYVDLLTITSKVAVFDAVMDMHNDKNVVVDGAYLQQGYVYEQYKQVVETTTTGYYKTPLIPVIGGRNIVFNTITPVAFQYCLFFDANQSLIGSAKSRITSVPQSNVNVNLPFDCAYIRFSISSQNVALVGAKYDTVKPFNAILRNKPIITFIDDDTSTVEYVTRYYNALNAAGVKGNYAVQTIELTNQVGLKELLLEYEEKGFGMLYHCHQQIDAYSVGNRNIVSAEADMVQGLREMQEAGFVNYRYWITPYGVFDAPIKAICMRHGMKCLVGSANWSYNLPQYGDKFHILRSDLHETDSSGSHTYAELQGLIDDAYTDNAWIIVTTHFNEWEDSSNDVRLTNIAQYALTKGFDCLTFAEAFELYGLPYTLYGLY